MDTSVEGKGPTPIEVPGWDRSKERRRRRFLAAVVRIGLRTGLVLLVFSVTAFFFLTRFPTGQRMALTYVLDRITEGLTGSFDVGGLRSQDLLAGVRLYDVSVDGPDDLPLLRVDSLDAEYTLAHLLAGRVILSSLTLYRPQVRIAPVEGEDRTNAELVLGLGAPAGSGSSTPREIRFLDATIVDGSVEILRSLGGAVSSRIPTVIGEGGRRLQVISMTGLQGQFPRAIVSSPDMPGSEITVEELTMEVIYFDDPLHVEELTGVARIDQGRLTVDAHRLRLPGSELVGSLWLGPDEGGGTGLGFDFEPLISISEMFSGRSPGSRTAR